MHPRRVNVLVALLLAAVTATAFSPAFRAGYVALDDPLYVAGNPHVPGGLTGDNLAWAFTTFLAGNWHPLTWLSLQLDATLFGTNPAGFHSTNVLLHAASAVLLYLALQALTGGRWRGALVAALFALHPLRVESVAWVSERKDVLSLLFGVAALWAYAEYARRPGAVRYLAVTLAFALSLLAKPMLVTLPFLLLVLDGWPLRRAVGSADWRRLTLEKLPLFALAAASCVVTVLAQQAGKAVGSVEVFSLSSRLANATVACATYLGMAAWPLNLAPFYPYRHAGWPVWQVGISGLILAGLSTLAVWQWQRRPYLLVGWLWYLGTLVPVIGLVQVGTQAYADRYTYFPQIGLAIAIVWTAADLCRERRARPVAIAAVVAAALLAVLTFRQTAFWHDDLTLWKHTLDVTGSNALAHVTLGSAVKSKHGGADEALQHFKKAVEDDPNYGLGHYYLAGSLNEAGRARDALEHYQRAIELNPFLAEAHNDLGGLLERKFGKRDEALQHYAKAVEIKGDYAAAHFNLARLLEARGQFDEAIHQYREALQLDPALVQAHLNLGSILEANGQSAEALSHVREAVRLAPNDGAAQGRLGAALAKRGEFDEAIAHLRDSARLRPTSSAAIFNLGVALEQHGQSEEALMAFRHALALDPKNLRNRLRLAGILLRLGQSAAADEEYRQSLRIDPGWPANLSRQAWRLATSPDPRSRDGDIAVEMAEHACRAGGAPSAPSLDVLAAAYAETGRFSDATATAEKARAVAKSSRQDELVREIDGRLALYRQRLPFREAASAAPRK